MDSIPLLSTDLIEDLDKHYPPVTASDVYLLSEKALVFKAGARKVVEFLQMRLAQDQDSITDV